MLSAVVSVSTASVFQHPFHSCVYLDRDRFLLTWAIVALQSQCLSLCEICKEVSEGQRGIMQLCSVPGQIHSVAEVGTKYQCLENHSRTHCTDLTQWATTLTYKPVKIGKPPPFLAFRTYWRKKFMTFIARN